MTYLLIYLGIGVGVAVLLTIALASRVKLWQYAFVVVLWLPFLVSFLEDYYETKQIK